MGWSEDLLPYRAEDNFRGAALVAQDKNLLRLAATWPLVEKTPPEPPAPGEEVNLEGSLGENQGEFRALGRTGPA